MNRRNELRYEQFFSGACLSSNDDRVELKCDTCELRSKCSKFEKSAIILLLKSVKLILF